MNTQRNYQDLRWLVILACAGSWSVAPAQSITLTDVPETERGVVAPASVAKPVAPRASIPAPTPATAPAAANPEAVAKAIETALAVRIAGSPAGQLLTQAVVEAYRKQRPEAQLTAAQPSGTAFGLAGLCAGRYDVVHTSRPIQKAELEACGKSKVDFVELPVAFDAVVLVTHAQNTFLDRISLEELRKLWGAAAQGQVLRWNEVNPRWPASPIRLLGPDRLSDEAHYFNDAILGEGQRSRADYAGSIDMNLVLYGIGRDTASLGYVPLAYYLGNRQRYKAVSVVNAQGQAVAPTVENIAAGRYQPLSRPVFLYVSAQALARPDVRGFVEYYLANGGRFAQQTNTVALPESTYREGLASVKTIKRGTAWAGTVPVGLTLETLRKRQEAL